MISNSFNSARAELNELEIIENGTVVINDGKVVYSGSHTDEYEANETIDATGKVVSPALVEAHTHLVHGGSREHAVALRVASTVDKIPPPCSKISK